MPRLFVVDTNVVVSGVLSFGRPSPPALVLKGMVSGRVPFVISAELLAEYRTVLLRPVVAERHVWSAVDVDGLLAELTMAAYLRQPPDDDVDPHDPPPEAPPGDAHLVRLLAHEPHAALVSGDQTLLHALRGRREMLAPAELVASELGEP